jgi:hypothetical protein
VKRIARNRKEIIMGVGKVVAEVGGGIATKKVVDNLLDNEGDNKSLGKTALSVGAGIAAAKVIDNAMDNDNKEEQHEAKGSGIGTVAGVVAAGAAVKAAMDVNSMKKEMAEQDGTERANPFQDYEATSVAPKQIENNAQNSFQALMRQQENNLQQTADNRGMNLEGADLDAEFSV